MKTSNYFVQYRYQGNQQGFPGAIKYWGICFRGEGLKHFGEDHSSNCFVDNGIGGYILAYTGKVT